MSYAQERIEFIARMSREGMELPTITALLRYATTLQRLAVAQCNGDWPADNGQRKVEPCSRCESLWVRSSMVRDRTAPKIQRPGESRPHWVPLICRDCRTQDLATQALQGTSFKPYFQGDPRGAVLRLMPLSATPENIDNGRERGIYVPARG